MASSSKMTLEAVNALEQHMAASTAQVETKKIVLSEEQKKILAIVSSGKSVFFTGSAGVGKSILLREIIKMLKQKYGPQGVAVTASTGLAATSIDGCTLHSFAGLGLAKETKEKLVGKLFAKHAAKARNRWQRTKALVIDEISMVDGAFFDKLEWIARQVCKAPTSNFGGIQLVVCGDYYQLPPVNGGFAFKTKSWKACFPEVYSLKTVFRQSDNQFVRILNDMRLGKVTDEAISVLSKLNRKVVYNDGIEPTHLMSRRDEVRSVNLTQLQNLPTQLVVLEAHDTACKAKPNKRQLSLEDAIKRLDRDTLAESSISLKVGAQVMCIKNLAQAGIVNGTLGTVTGFSTEAGLDKINSTRKPEDKIGVGSVAAPGELREPLFDPESEPATADEEDSAPNQTSGVPAQEWPIVKFALCGALDGQTKELLMPPVSFSVNDADGDPEANRDQTPLMLAWALTIHKAQGQTLQRVKIDLGGVFEKGQAYVAISRAVSLDRLELRGFVPGRVMVHPDVVAWSKTLL